MSDEEFEKARDERSFQSKGHEGGFDDVVRSAFNEGADWARAYTLKEQQWKFDSWKQEEMSWKQELEAKSKALEIAKEALRTLKVAVNDKVKDPGATNFCEVALAEIESLEKESGE